MFLLKASCKKTGGFFYARFCNTFEKNKKTEW